MQRGHLRRPVAIKLLTRLSDEYIELFRDEMRVMSQLRNSHVVQFLDSGSHHSVNSTRAIPYLVMEFIEGETLAHHLLSKGALPPSQVITVLRQIVSALAEAHRYGVIHRDIKPLNLMINFERNGQPQIVVLDFGIARAAESATRDATRNRIMGTPYYLAPEVLIEGKVTHQTDLFAAAVIAYESLCFRSPFVNEELTGIEPYLKLRTLYAEGQPPDPLPPHLPSEWSTFFECALAVDPSHRFPSADVMVMAIDELEKRTKETHRQIES